MAPSCCLIIWACLMLAAAAEEEGCSAKSCGGLNISYPFWVADKEAERPCGDSDFEVFCNSTTNAPFLRGSFGFWFAIIGISYENRSLHVVDVDKGQDLDASNASSCRAWNTSVKLPLSFQISPTNLNLIIYDCTKMAAAAAAHRVPELFQIKCGSESNMFARLGGHFNGSSGDHTLQGCNSTFLPALNRSGKTSASDYEQLISDGFLLTWKPQPPPLPPLPRHKGTGRKIRLIVLTSATAALLFPCIYVLIWQRKGKKLCFLRSKKTSSCAERSYKAMLVSYGSLAPKRYMYSEVMKITSSRDNQLGKGGYGIVYKGRLQDGRVVAVKFLHDCQGNGEEFVNEVMSIGRTSHVNIVSLFGFCLEGSRRALIYEYTSNGSLDTYIYSENPKEILGWKRLYAIAIGVARGLEYLHHGCNTRIVHFDIKPQNILLDQDFCPKVADFGLAKLCRTKESNLSMTGARGTIGFIAPEVHSQIFGIVSTKSDVYSYGMMLLEMVGGRKNVKSVAEKSSEKYFPDWIYHHFGRDEGLQACEATSETEETARKMTLVGLWCIQVLPMHRPTMTNVLEMFEKRLDELDLPPKQSFCELLENSAHNMSVQSASSTNPEERSRANSKNLQRSPTL